MDWSWVALIAAPVVVFAAVGAVFTQLREPMRQYASGSEDFRRWQRTAIHLPLRQRIALAWATDHARPAPPGSEQLAVQRANALITHLQVQQSPAWQRLYRAMAAFAVVLALGAVLLLISDWPGSWWTWLLCPGWLAMAVLQWTRPAAGRRQQRRLQDFLDRHAAQD